VRDAVLLALLGLTSLALYLVGVRRLGLSPAGFRAACHATLEVVGLGVVFFALNTALAVLAVAAARVVTGGFVSLYAIDDLTIGAASLLQGLVWRWWRDRG
jgi:hypothetical protein